MTHAEFLVSLALRDYTADTEQEKQRRLFRIADYLLNLEEINGFLEDLVLERGEVD